MTTLPHRSFASANIVVSGSRRDDQVIEELYLRHKPAAVRYARRRGAEDPEGVFDNVFADVLAKSQTLQGPTDDAFAAYLYRSISNRVITEQRKMGAPSVSFDEQLHATAGLTASFDGDLARTVWLEELLDNLTDLERTVVEKRYFEDQTSVATAQAMGKSPEAVRQLHQSAMRRLRFLLAVAVAVVAVAVAIGVVSRVMSEPVRTTPVGSIEEPQVSTSTTAVSSAPAADLDQDSDAGPVTTLVVATEPVAANTATVPTALPQSSLRAPTTMVDMAPPTAAPTMAPEVGSTTTTSPVMSPAAEVAATTTSVQPVQDGQSELAEPAGQTNSAEQTSSAELQELANSAEQTSSAELQELANRLLEALRMSSTTTTVVDGG